MAFVFDLGFKILSSCGNCWSNMWSGKIEVRIAQKGWYYGKKRDQHLLAQGRTLGSSLCKRNRLGRTEKVWIGLRRHIYRGTAKALSWCLFPRQCSAPERRWCVNSRRFERSVFCLIPSCSISGFRGNWSWDDLLCCIHAERVTTSYRRWWYCSISPTKVFNFCVEGVQFPATALFSFLRRYCSFRTAEVFSLGRHIHKDVCCS